MMPIERWASRAPSTRWPLVLLALLLLVGLGGGLTGCGGGDEIPEPLATGTSSTQAGDADTGAALLVLPLQGPTLTLEQPATVRVRLVGQVLQGSHYAAHGTLAVELTQPQPTGASSVAVPLLGPTTLPVDYVALLDLPAGTTELVAQATVRATDTNGLTTTALGHAEATVHWVVTLESTP